MSNIDITIDMITECLIDRQTGLEQETEIAQVKGLSLSCWLFDWNIEFENGHTVYALRLKGQTQIQGLISFDIDTENKAVFVHLAESAPHNVGSKGRYLGVGGHLFAEAVKKSMEAGYEGFVHFKAKTSLINHYEKSLGAIHVGGGIMYINEIAAYNLYEKYYGGKL